MKDPLAWQRLPFFESGPVIAFCSHCQPFLLHHAQSVLGVKKDKMKKVKKNMIKKVNKDKMKKVEKGMMNTVIKDMMKKINKDKMKTRQT